MAGVVYFVRDEQSRIKIGYTSYNPINRVQTLQTGSASKLDLLGWVKVDNPSLVESIMHEMLSRYRYMGEWFVISLERLCEYLRWFERYLLNPHNEFGFEWSFSSVSTHGHSWQFLDDEMRKLFIGVDDAQT